MGERGLIESEQESLALANPAVGRRGSGVLLEVDRLTVDYATPGGLVRAVDEVSFGLEPGETLGIIGESGSGKSTLANALLGLLPHTARKRVHGDVRIGGVSVVTSSERDLSRLRGKVAAMIPQGTSTALNPVLRVGEQLDEAITLHNKSMSKRARRTQTLELLKHVGLTDPERVYRSYPHQLSGGMRQRVLISMAVANGPELLIADEPTTALDVTIQAQVIKLLKRIQQETGSALIFISHDVALVEELADKVLVMYAGKVVESSPVAEFRRLPGHPYSLGLSKSVPVVSGDRQVGLKPVPGSPPVLTNLPSGCPFHPRCPSRTDICVEQMPPLADVGRGDLSVACHHPVGEDGQADRLFVNRGELLLAEAISTDCQPRLQVADLFKTFTVRARGRKRHVEALRGVSLEVKVGETLAVVGESGSGKSTLARCIAGLETPDKGRILISGNGGAQNRGEFPAGSRGRVQMVFQDPYGSLDPMQTVADTVIESLSDKNGSLARAEELVNLVGLDGSFLGRYPRELSGGQRQRVGIARALAAEPDLILLDEPTAALDVSIQAQILLLLLRLQKELGLSFLLITHDLSIVWYMAHRVTVMRAGEVLETNSTTGLFSAPETDYTRALLEASRRSL